MRWPWSSGDVVPDDVRLAASLTRGERVLAWARGDDGTWLLGTRARVVVLGPRDDGSAPPDPVSVPWEQVEDAGWDAESTSVRLREVGEYAAPRREWRVVVSDLEPRAFLQLLRERVTASVVLQRKASVHGKRGVVVACRRSPVGGPLHWHVAFDPGVDPDDPTVLRAAEQLLAQVRAELGEAAAEVPAAWRPLG